MIEKKLILGIGHPRTGTKFTSELLRSWGLNVGHEYTAPDGIVAWQFTVKDKEIPIFAFLQKNLYREQYEYETIIYNVRNPLYSLPSIANTEKPSLNYRKKFIEITDDNILSQAIQSLIEWDKLVRKNDIDIIFRIEDQQKYLFDELINKIDKKINYTERQFYVIHNSRKHKGWEELKDLIKNTPEKLLEDLNDYCIRYGYNPIFNVSNKTLINDKNE